jgi:hypothetical protein
MQEVYKSDSFRPHSPDLQAKAAKIYKKDSEIRQRYGKNSIKSQQQDSRKT